MSLILNDLITKIPKPCPFCGATPEYGEADELTPAGIFCNNEDCGVQPDVWQRDEDETFEDILAQWDYRQEDTNA